VAAKKSRGTTEVQEKRLRAFRHSAPAGITDRIKRALSQRMYLVDRVGDANSDSERKFRVLGSTGNLYDVTISRQLSCSCIDFVKGNCPCKHIIFVFCRVLAQPRHSQHIYQLALLSTELSEIFAFADKKGAEAAVAVQAAQAVVDAAQGKSASSTTSEAAKPVPKGDCSICFEDVEGAKEACTSCSTCKNFFHKACMDNWLKAARARASNASCPNCRSDWVSQEAPKGEAQIREGYTNLGALAGLKTSRDSSSYYQGRGRYGYGRYDDDRGDY